MNALNAYPRRVALALSLVLATASTARAQTQPVAANALSLEDAIRIAERQSESVRIAEAGVLRARGTQSQARAQYLPQINGSANYQKALQNQFQAISSRSATTPDTATGPRLSSLCAPNIPSTATPAERQAALQQAQTCAAGGDALGGISRIFASPYTLTLGLTGSQTLFSGGRVQALNQVANASRRSAEIGVTSARAQLQLDVAQAYYGAVLADRLVQISESSFVQSERTFRQTSLAQQVGNVAEFDLLRARVTRDNQRPVLIQARASRDVAYLQLRQLLNLPATQPLQLTTTLPLPTATPAQRSAAAPNATAPNAVPNTSGAITISNPMPLDFNPADVLADDPRVSAAIDSAVQRADTAARDRASARQSRENVTVQRNVLRQARAQRLPQVSLSSVYQRFAYPSGGFLPLPSSFNQLYPNWTVALGVSLPIFTGGRIRGDELVAEAGLREAEQTAQQVEELSALDAQVALSALAQAEATWLATSGTSEQAERAYTISEVRYREGISTLVELSDSRLLLQQSQTNAATAARDLQIARLKLALLRDLPLTSSSAAQQQSASRQGTAGNASAGGAGASAGSSGGSTGQQSGSSSSTQQRSATSSAGGFQTTGTAGGGVP